LKYKLYSFTLNLCSTNFSYFILSNLKVYHSFNLGQLSHEKLHCRIKDPDQFDDYSDQAFHPNNDKGYGTDPDTGKMGGNLGIAKCYGSAKMIQVRQNVDSLVVDKTMQIRIMTKMKR
jgi:hypothetical protein